MLNRNAHETLGSPTRVKLLYDTEAHKIGIRATQSDNPSTDFKVRVQNIYQVAIAATRFLRHFGIPIDPPRRYAAKIEGDMLVVDLKENPLWKRPPTKVN